MNKKIRNSNLELLRIFSMLFIVAHHFGVHGGFNLIEKSFILNKVIIQIISSGGKFGRVWNYFCKIYTFYDKSYLIENFLNLLVN